MKEKKAHNNPPKPVLYGPDNPHPLSAMKTELVWERREILLWRRLARENITESQELLNLMRRYVELEFKDLDALHIASAVVMEETL
ncbi:MAG: hypothetical protein HZA01_11775 [Nitrospinae bacterium]|nr:hypothetical protein [Nitrospinota bacterium]